MNENAKKKAKQKEVLEGIKAKYDKKEELTEDKKEVLQSWIKGIDRRGTSAAGDDEYKKKQLVLKLARTIEDREAKRKAAR